MERPMLKVRKIDHVAICVADPAEAAKKYEAIFGLGDDIGRRHLPARDTEGEGTMLRNRMMRGLGAGGGRCPEVELPVADQREGR